MTATKYRCTICNTQAMLPESPRTRAPTVRYRCQGTCGKLTEHRPVDMGPWTRAWVQGVGYDA